MSTKKTLAIEIESDTIKRLNDAQMADLQNKIEALRIERISDHIRSLRKQYVETITEIQKQLETYGLDMHRLVALTTDEQIKEYVMEFIGRPPPVKRIPPKYRNPDNPQQTWTGRGNAPHWVKEFLAAGGDLDDCLIDKRQAIKRTPARKPITSPAKQAKIGRGKAAAKHARSK